MFSGSFTSQTYGDHVRGDVEFDSRKMIMTMIYKGGYQYQSKRRFAVSAPTGGWMEIHEVGFCPIWLRKALFYLFYCLMVLTVCCCGQPLSPFAIQSVRFKLGERVCLEEVAQLGGRYECDLPYDQGTFELTRVLQQ